MSQPSPSKPNPVTLKQALKLQSEAQRLILGGYAGATADSKAGRSVIAWASARQRFRLRTRAVIGTVAKAFLTSSKTRILGQATELKTGETKTAFHPAHFIGESYLASRATDLAFWKDEKASKAAMVRRGRRPSQ